MTREEVRENNKQAVKALKEYIRVEERSKSEDAPATMWKELVDKHFQGDATNARKMLTAIMFFPLLFEE